MKDDDEPVTILQARKKPKPAASVAVLPPKRAAAVEAEEEEVGEYVPPKVTLTKNRKAYSDASKKELIRRAKLVMDEDDLGQYNPKTMPFEDWKELKEVVEAQERHNFGDISEDEGEEVYKSLTPGGSITVDPALEDYMKEVQVRGSRFLEEEDEDDVPGVDVTRNEDGTIGKKGKTEIKRRAKAVEFEIDEIKEMIEGDTQDEWEDFLEVVQEEEKDHGIIGLGEIYL